MIMDRLKEPSSYAGLSAIAMLLGVNYEVIETLAYAVSSIAGVIAIFVPDKPAS